jgi:hypothetical protein
MGIVMKTVSLQQQIERLQQIRTQLAQQLHEKKGKLEQRTKCLCLYNKIVSQMNTLENIRELGKAKKTGSSLIRSALNPYAPSYVKGQEKKWLRQHQKRSSGWANFLFLWTKNNKGNWATAGRKWRSLTKDERACWKNHNDALIAGHPGI